MQKRQLTALFDEIEKISEGLGGAALDVAGLGILAAPTVYRSVTGKKPSEKNSRKAELAGLGTLALPSAARLLGHK